MQTQPLPEKGGVIFRPFLCPHQNPTNEALRNLSYQAKTYTHDFIQKLCVCFCEKKKVPTPS